MPNYTPNYNLKKPLPNENYNIQDFNDNADIIDQKLKEVEDSVVNIEVPVTSVNGKTGDVELTAADVGAETPEGAQEKADIAEQNAKNYADAIKPTKVSQLQNDVGYITSQRPVSNSVTSTSSTTAASSKAVKTAYDKAVEAYDIAEEVGFVADFVKPGSTTLDYTHYSNGHVLSGSAGYSTVVVWSVPKGGRYRVRVDARSSNDKTHKLALTPGTPYGIYDEVTVSGTTSKSYYLDTDFIPMGGILAVAAKASSSSQLRISSITLQADSGGSAPTSPELLYKNQNY